MRSSTSTLVALASLVSLSTAGYVLEDDYTTSSFFSMFDFYTDSDPTHGYVDYVDKSAAQDGGLISTDNGTVYIGVDHTNVASGSGRKSVRLTSTKTYTHALVVLDLAHMPGGICGSWPAFWMVGPDWPNGGEIDIIEGVNSQTENDMTLHTAAGCSVNNTNDFSGSMGTSNCDVNAAGQASNAGCQIAATQSATYGKGFNSNGGGVYAMEWTSDVISIYFFERGSIPSDITEGSPTPLGWGSPSAQFKGNCDIDTYFQDLNIVFDTTFCGDWAGAVWSTDSTCSAKSSSCNSYVQNNPSDFAEAYWSVNSLRVYQYSDSVVDFSTIGSSTTGTPVVTGASFTHTSVIGAGATTTDSTFSLNSGDAGSTYSSPKATATASTDANLAPAAAYPATSSGAAAVTAGQVATTESSAAAVTSATASRFGEPVIGVASASGATAKAAASPSGSSAEDNSHIKIVQGIDADQIQPAGDSQTNGVGRPVAWDKNKNRRDAEANADANADADAIAIDTVVARETHLASHIKGMGFKGHSSRSHQVGSKHKRYEVMIGEELSKGSHVVI